MDNEISQLYYVGDIVEPQMQLRLSDNKLIYANGTFDKSRLTVTTILSCGAKKPYRDSDLTGTEVEDMTAEFTGYTIELPQGLYFGKISSKNDTYTAKISDAVVFGRDKQYIHEFYVDTQNYFPAKVSQTLTIQGSMSAAEGRKQVISTRLTVGNLDISSNNASNKYANSTDGQLAAEAAAVLQNMQIAIGDDGTMKRIGMDDRQVNCVKNIIKAWIGNIMAVDILTKDTSQDSGWAALWEAAGINDADKQKFIGTIAEKAFDKLGLDVSAISGTGSYMNISSSQAKTTIKVQSKENKKKFYVVSVEMVMGTYAFTSKKPFSGYGTLSYTVTDLNGMVHDSSLQQGSITYANVQDFAECVQEIGMKSIHKVYDKYIGENADKAKEFCRKAVNETTGNRFVEAITSDTSNKILEKFFGKFSDNVYTVLYGNLEKKRSEGSSACPVDLYIYDGEGNLCGSVVNNEVTSVNDDIFLYVVEDRKYFILSGDDYDIEFVGNGTGEMDYVLEEYEGENLVRTLIYHAIPLEQGKIYYGRVPYVQMQDSSIYSPMAVDDLTMIDPVSDIVENMEEPTPGNSEEKPGTEKNTGTNGN